VARSRRSELIGSGSRELRQEGAHRAKPRCALLRSQRMRVQDPFFRSAVDCRAGTRQGSPLCDHDLGANAFVERVSRHVLPYDLITLEMPSLVDQYAHVSSIAT
jgi:hypothetical protein